MPSELKELPPLPTAGEAVVDPRTGRMTTSWYLYFIRFDQHMREVEKRLDADEANIGAIDLRVTDLETP